MKPGSFLLFLFCSVFFIACSANREDEKIQQDINDLFKKDLAGAALNATVNNGVANITGQCAGSGCTADIVEKVKKVKGVQQVQTNILEK